MDDALQERRGPAEHEGREQGSAPTWLDLFDYRLRVAAMYRERDRALREGQDELRTLARFREAKDALFASHPQTPISAEQRAHFTGLRYFAYDHQFRVEATLSPESSTAEAIEARDGSHTLYLRRAARLDFEIGSTSLHLTLFWIDVYGGGLFLPFRDLTCPEESYGGGRYLFDTVKGSDFLPLGAPGEVSQGFASWKIVLDFNYAYNPSCAYDSRWVCPLAPRENWLPVPIRAGEKAYLAEPRI